MDFSVNLLDTVVACDKALHTANRTKADLEFRLLALTRQYNDAVESATNNQVEWATAHAERSIILHRLEAAQPGQSDNDLIKRRMQLDLKIFTLNQRIQSRGMSLVIELEYAISRIEQELELNASLIGKLTQRKSILANQAA